MGHSLWPINVEQPSDWASLGLTNLFSNLKKNLDKKTEKHFANSNICFKTLALIAYK